MKTTHTFARQPILDTEKNIYGYEFYYRNNVGESGFENARAATASLLVALLNQIGLQKASENRPLFINIDSSVLLTDLLLAVPPKLFVFALPADAQLGTREAEVLRKLHHSGYRFALENIDTQQGLTGVYDVLLPFIDFIKIDASATDNDLLPKIVDRFKGKQLVAERVEIDDVFDAYRESGFRYFQGFACGAPVLMEYNRVDPKHMGVVKIYNMLLDGTPMDQIAKEMRNHNELSMQLLQYLHSHSLNNPFPNRSIEEIIVKMGTEQLKHWLSLIIFAKSGQTIQEGKSPLSKLMEQRIDVMHCTISCMQSEDEQLFDSARLMALISLMEPVLGLPLKAALSGLPVDNHIEDALLLHSGRLGKIFGLALALEKDDAASVRLLMDELGLEPEILPTLKNMIKM
ncbi:MULTISPECIES: EAL and HDOD domain-containing protein [Sulfurimonas]|uniref:EAL domain-containing protein n=1 Tax=Sulfurimonas diazotrophicus TaxID=3131939 RepID=A0ABZ3H7S8_9BACT